MQMVNLKWRYRGVKQNLKRARAFFGRNFFQKKFKREKIFSKTYLKKKTKNSSDKE
jgi:hypothetical protein